MGENSDSYSNTQVVLFSLFPSHSLQSEIVQEVRIASTHLEGLSIVKQLQGNQVG